MNLAATWPPPLPGRGICESVFPPVRGIPASPARASIPDTGHQFALERIASALERIAECAEAFTGMELEKIQAEDGPDWAPGANPPEVEA
jgi:hypothetical protein